MEYIGMHITKTIVALCCALAAGAGHAQSHNAAQSGSQSDSGAVASNGPITFEASAPLRHQSVSSTPPVYVPSAFVSPGTCGMTDGGAVAITGFGGGFSKSRESDYCNARQDTATAWNLGYQDVAALRFFCFGSDENRMAFEASGRACPEGSTAKGLQRQQVAGYQGNDPIVISRLQGK